MCLGFNWVLSMNEREQRRQRILRYAVFAIVAVVFCGFSWYVVMDFVDIKPSKSLVSVSSPRLPLDGIDPKEIWVDQIRSENEVVHGKVDFMQDIVMQRAKKDEEKDISVQKQLTAVSKELENLKSELSKYQANSMTGKDLREELRAVKDESYNAINRDNDIGFSDFFDPFASTMPQELIAPLSTVSCPEPKNLKHIDRAIPSGTTVKAILLSSVDMPCSVKGGTDPLPVKLRIITDGRLPHQIRARLKSGIVTASVYGDLSSERVYFRLEKLTQFRNDGHYIETQVAGYVSGEDGKYGLRGTVVDRSACLIENAMISGFLSGASNFFESAATTRLFPSCYPNEGNCQMSWKNTAGQLAIAGGSGGATNALDALTDYFINRAEQLRPVIQIAPGRHVDITFSDSADLGDLYTHERVRNSGKGDGVCGS